MNQASSARPGRLGALDEAPLDLDPAEVAALIERYDRPAPRYTSYPTALDFGPLDSEVAEAHLAGADARASEPLSVYVHLPFCEERCWFCGCHVVITPHLGRATPYLDQVRAELDRVAGWLPRRRGLGQLHFGGGTPTYFPAPVLRAFAADLLGRFEVAPGAELAVEVDPRVTTEAHLEALASVGFNRVSFGVQDLEPQVQEAIGRVQPEAAVARLVRAAAAMRYRGINADLIYGLPHQTPASIARTAARVVALGVQRIALYSFAHLPDVGRGHQRQIDPASLPTGVAKLRLFAEARRVFLREGFVPIGMDHFAAPTDELAEARRQGRLRRNFQGYTTLPSTDVIGLGASAIGDVDGALLQNEKKLSRYGQRLRAGALPTARGVVRTAEDRLRAAVIAELMCNLRLDYRDLSDRLGVDVASVFAPELERLGEHEERGLLVRSAEGLRLTGSGQLLVRSIATVFDAYRRPRAGATSAPAGFSRAI